VCVCVYIYIYIYIYIYKVRDSLVGIATRYGLDVPGGSNRGGGGARVPHTASCTMGTGSFPGLKRPGHGVDNPSDLTSRLKK